MITYALSPPCHHCKHMDEHSKSKKETNLGITGMTCATCAGTVERALSGRHGVSRATVNIAAEKAMVEYDPSVAGEKDLVRAIEDAGYGVVANEIVFVIVGMTCAPE